MKTLDFIFDFASPNAYLVHKVIPKIRLRRNIKINYIPCLLGGIFKETNKKHFFKKKEFAKFFTYDINSNTIIAKNTTIRSF